MTRGPEAPIEDYLVLGTKLRGGWAAKMVDKGRRGAPDRELRFPSGVLIYAETKCLDGKLYRWQEEYHLDLKALGFPVVLLWSIPQVDKFFAEYDRGVYG